MFSFLLGLLTGFVEQNFSNVRMGSPRIKGVMNGTFLGALGAVWTDVRLSPPLKVAAYWSALYGPYANWAVTVLAGSLVPQPCPQFQPQTTAPNLGRQTPSRSASSAWG
jgi:hydroxylaminobenzene mutase